MSAPRTSRRSAPTRRYIDHGDHRKAILLAGTGRSGTTWIAEAIGGADGCRLMFEPFHSRRTDLVRHWNYRQYLRPENRDPAFIEPATRILSGQVHGSWVDQLNTANVARRRLVKDIRVNLLLPWIHGAFPEIPIVLLLRHPCAVASSKLSLRWGTVLPDFLSQPELMEDYLAPFEAEIRAAIDPFDRHIFMWCIENYVPLRSFSAGQIRVAFYEDCSLRPQTEARELLTFVGEPAGPALEERIRKPSAMSRPESAIVTGESIIDGWRRRIPKELIERAVRILSLFGLDRIYGESSVPAVSGDEALTLMKPQGAATHHKDR